MCLFLCVRRLRTGRVVVVGGEHAPSRPGPGALGGNTPGCTRNSAPQPGKAPRPGASGTPAP